MSNWFLERILFGVKRIRSISSRSGRETEPIGIVLPDGGGGGGGGGGAGVLPAAMTGVGREFAQLGPILF